MRILVIEDNIRLADTIADALRCENYIVDIANDGVQGYEDAASGIYDMLILDLMLPKMNGYEVLSTLRREGNDIPVLILSARMELDDKVQGFAVGTDDYVTKPFEIQELQCAYRRSPADVCTRISSFCMPEIWLLTITPVRFPTLTPAKP